ncbi:MAG: trypsin-like peptidase domain-containing protein [Planctomycetaceae bacterium]
MPASLAHFCSLNAVIFCCLPFSAAAETSVRETALVRAVRECRGAVVNIHTEKSTGGGKENRFFAPRERKVTGMGTGIVVDERGYIVTNCHVILDVEEIIVTQEDGETYSARVFEVDREHDLAIIRVYPAKPMKVLEMGTSSDVMLAEQVFAVGNAYGYEHTVTAGIVSAVARDVEVDETQSYEDLIQTDASINPGNSGGPLLNLDGEVIGINVAIRAGAQRIGFAIPIDAARRVIARLLSAGSGSQGAHGLMGTDVNTANDQHFVVDAIVPGSPAAQCGLKIGDVVRRVRDTTIKDNADWERSLLELPLGKGVDVTVDRDGESVAMQLTMGTVPRSPSQVTAHTASVTSGRSTIDSSATTEESVDNGSRKAWQRFGIRVADLSERERRTLPQRYNGGMKILFVQSGGPGARHGLRNGDILVGLDGYETLAEQNLNFVLSDSRIRSTEKISFQIVRNGNEALVGSISLKENVRRPVANGHSVRR